MGMSMISGLLTQPLFPFSFASPSVKRRTAVVYQRTIKWFCLIASPDEHLPGLAGTLHQFLFGKQFMMATPALMILESGHFLHFCFRTIRSIQRAGPPKGFFIIMFAALAARIS